MKPRIVNSYVFVLVVSVVAQFFAAPAWPKTPNGPDRLIIMVFDAMRPDYIDRFNLKNFKRLRSMGQNYPEAYLGHMQSETVVSHFVIPTGLQPKVLPWQDDVFLDSAGLLGKPGAFYLTGDLSGEQLHKAMSVIPENRYLISRLKERVGGKYFAVGAKTYAAYIFGGPHADGIVTFRKENDRCSPTGVRVPEYITKNDRFTVECKNRYGTEMSFYPWDGRHVPGNDPKHLGGDVWVTDVAFELMKNEDWRGLLLTYSGIDKASHLLGEHEGPKPHIFKPQFSFEDILRTADAQMGRILDELTKRKLLNRTMIVVTADHGGIASDYYFGTGGEAHVGKVENAGADEGEAPFWLKSLSKFAKTKMIYGDSAIRVWNGDESKDNRRKIIDGLTQMSGVTQVYEKQELDSEDKSDWHYMEVWSRLDKESKAHRNWAKLRSKELLDSMANKVSPDYVALLQDNVGYGLPGDHGGAQEKVQRVPLITFVPGERPARKKAALRVVDIYNLVLDKI